MWDRIGPGDWSQRTIEELAPQTFAPFKG
jgi:hypothetical protein